MRKWIGATLAGFAAMVVSPAVAQEALSDPGWSDPAFAQYLDALKATDATDSAASAPFGVAFSLPVLGLPAVEPGNAAASQLRAGAQPMPLGASVADWPACAAANPAITTIPETPDQSAGIEPGSWYVRTLDFGCVVLVIEGSRSAPPSDGAAASPELQESGAMTIEYFDENAGQTQDEEGRVVEGIAAQELPDRGSPTIGIALGGLTYGMTVECLVPESRGFCNSEKGLRELTRQLTVVDGQPEN